MNPFHLNPAELISEWRSVRDDLNKHSEDEQLQIVAKWWAQCPFANWSLYPDKPETWVTPWEMFHDNYYCHNAIAIGMLKTLELGGWDADKLKLAMTRNKKDGEEKFIAIVNSHYVLNYDYSDVIELDDIKDDITMKYDVVLDRYGNFKLAS